MRMLAELTKALPVPPSAVGWYKGYDKTPIPMTSATGNILSAPAHGVSSWPMDCNDKLGCCTIAGAAHLIQLWTTLTGSPVVPTDDQVVSEYSRLCGYNPSDPNSDQGGVESDILEAWQSDGIFGHKISGYVGINPQSAIQMKEAIWFFGGAYLGVGLPISAQNQTVWDVPTGSHGKFGDGASGSWGGHCVPAVAADERFVVVVTWGAIKLMTWQFVQAYCDEAYALLSPDWMENSGLTVGGVPLASLQADLNRLKMSA
jgi:hypothetical protein